MMIWVYTILAIIAFCIVLLSGFLVALRLADWQDTQEDYDADNEH